VDRQELAAFLRSRRERISAADVGLPAGRRRRTPGLRREEVAQLAYISTEYYTRLEQARAPRPSREVLAGLARALRLSEAERGHLHHLAGAPPGPPPGPRREVHRDILDLLDRLPQAAVMVLSATYEVIAWNDLAAALMGDFSALSPRERNLIRYAFLNGSRPPVLAEATPAPAKWRSWCRSCWTAAPSSPACGPRTTCPPGRACARPCTTRWSAPSP
jgi:transcriptional regulator with XRE-family HTH domain